MAEKSLEESFEKQLADLRTLANTNHEALHEMASTMKILTEHTKQLNKQVEDVLGKGSIIVEPAPPLKVYNDDLRKKLLSQLAHVDPDNHPLFKSLIDIVTS